MGAAKRGLLAMLVVLAGSAISYVLMVEAAGELVYRAWDCLCSRGAVSLAVLDRVSRVEAGRGARLKWRRARSTNPLGKPTITGWQTGCQQVRLPREQRVSTLRQSADDSNSGSSSDDASGSDSDDNSGQLERFSSAPDSLTPQISSASAAKHMARRILRRGSDSMPINISAGARHHLINFRCAVQTTWWINGKTRLAATFELLRVDFAAIDADTNIASLPGTPVDLDLRAPNDGSSDSEDDSLGVRILERGQSIPDSQNFEPRYFGATLALPRRYTHCTTHAKSLKSYFSTHGLIAHYSPTGVSVRCSYICIVMLDVCVCLCGRQLFSSCCPDILWCCIGCSAKHLTRPEATGPPARS